MSLFLARRTKRPVFLLSTPLSLSQINYHGHHSSPAFLGSLNWRRERGVFGKQMRFFDGSCLPLSRLLYSCYYHCFHSLCCQVSFVLPHPFSFSLFSRVQEKMLDSKSREVYFRGLEHGSGISKMPILEIHGSVKLDRDFRSISAWLNLNSADNLSVSFGRTRGSNVAYAGFSFFPMVNNQIKILNWKHMGRCRTFSSSSASDEEGVSENDGAGCYDDEYAIEQRNEVIKSTADAVEVDRVCNVIEKLFALDRNMEAVLDECGIILTHDLVVDVLMRFRHARKPAFRFFCWAGQKPGFSHDSRTYNVMMMILGRTRQFETMVSLLEEMGDKGLLTLETFTISIRAFAAAKERKKAVGMFELMKRHNFKAVVETINCLLDTLGKQKLAKEAQALYDKLKGRFTPNMQTYTALLGGWCKVNNLMEAGKIWNEMIDQGFKPDTIAHHIMLEGLLKAHKRSDAIKLFEVMKAKGPAPNVRSYTIIIRYLCKHGKMEEAVSYFDEMLDSGCNLDAAVYTCLITGFGNQKKMDKVYGLLKEMKEKGCSPDVRTYNALIKLMTNRRMPDDAIRVYKKMVQSGIQPSIHTYNMLMKSQFLARNIEMARAVLDEMVRNGCCPDDNSYAVLIRGLIKEGRPEEACRYIEEMLEKGMKIPQLDLSKFAADISRAGMPYMLDELANKMKRSGKLEVSEVLSRCARKIKEKR